MPLETPNRFGCLPVDVPVPNVQCYTISAIQRELRQHFCIPVRLTGRNRSIVTQAMVDSGANTIFLSDEFVRRNQVHTEPLPKPVRLTNADGSANAIGMITHEADLRMTVGDHTECVRAAVASIGHDDLIIGVDWLRYHNPSIDWTRGRLEFDRCPPECGGVPGEVTETGPWDAGLAVYKTAGGWRRGRGRKDWGGSKRVAHMQAEAMRVAWAELEEEADEGELADVSIPIGYRFSEVYNDIYKDAAGFYVAADPECAHRIAASHTWSQAIAEKSATHEGDKTFEEMVPPEFRSFRRVFSKEASERLPTRKPYDHAIDLEPGSVPSFAKIYPMPPSEQKALEEYLEENLRKGYIRPSKSPAASPVYS